MTVDTLSEDQKLQTSVDILNQMIKDATRESYAEYLQLRMTHNGENSAPSPNFVSFASKQEHSDFDFDEEEQDEFRLPIKRQKLIERP